MKILMTHRGGGKTTQCVEYLRRDLKAVLVVSSKARALDVRQQYTFNESQVARRILAWDEIIEDHKGSGYSGVVIDDIDALLTRLFELPVVAISLTWPPTNGEDWTPPTPPKPKSTKPWWGTGVP
jgi:hypothetical protein